MKVMRFVLPALVLVLGVGASAQRGDALKNLKVEESASPELVGRMAKELAISPGQAQGAAGALLGLAKSKLSPAEFGEVAKAIPGADGLLKAAPAIGGGERAGGLTGLAGLAGSFKQLGLDAGMIVKAAPILSKFAGDKGGAGAAKLLANVLK